MTEGILIVNKKSLQVKFTNKNNKEVTCNVKESELSAPILQKKQNAIAQLNNLAVEFEEMGGQPKTIREKGQQWQASTSQSSRNAQSSPPQNQAIRQKTSVNMKREFHNPYNFIPTPPRNTKHSELGDHLPKGHGCYHQDYWSGRISVTLETITPLLIPDAANAREDQQKKDHKIYDIRVNAQGKPYLPPTSIKGMLRSAYEAVTNSRFGIFEKHEDRLAYRMSTQSGLKMVPARIENSYIYLYTGTSNISDDGKPMPGHPMYAAWLKCYNPNNGQIATTPKHGQKITAWVEKYKKVRNNGQVIFSYWKVRKIVPFGENIGQQPRPSNGFGNHQSTREMKKIDGFVCLTNKNIDNKHDERVFFSINQPIKIQLTPDIRKKWTELITNYKDIHKAEIERGISCPPTLNYSVWSRHVTGLELEKNLSDGTLCYAQVRKNGNDYNVIALYPVMISRGLYQVSPNDLLHDSLKPADCIDSLSPADRVFGWVKQDSQPKNQQKVATSYKGNLRIFNVTCESSAAIEHFENNGFPLAILGKPKEQQARFYQAKDKEGNPSDHENKEQGYASKSQGLRGRKVYPHHKGLPNNHWQDPHIYRPKEMNQHSQEYRQPSGKDERTDQNRSIKAWIKPNVKFSFTIDLINLSSVELGALLWLLSLKENHFHRLGLGKPFGFGSVKLSINWQKTDLRKGQAWQKYYQSLISIPAPDVQLSKACINDFITAVEQAYGNGKNFAEIAFIKSFLITAKGFEDNLPIHYPRINCDSKGFDWFVENESVNRELKLSLPLLTEDQGLPYNPRNNT